MKIEDLQIPVMRSELYHYLDRLQDEDFQVAAWKERLAGAPPTRFRNIINFLFDDTSLSSDASGYVGVVLLDEQEADAVRAVTSKIDVMLKRHGWKGTDAEYLTLPEWPLIVEAARRAITLIGPGTPKFPNR